MTEQTIGELPFQAIARLERELAEARAKIEGLTVDEDWTKDDHVAMVNEANAQLQAFASGLEANLAAVIQRAENAEADAEALRALAAWGSSDADNRVKFHVGNQANVWVLDASSKVHYAGGATLAAAIMDALSKVSV